MSHLDLKTLMTTPGDHALTLNGPEGLIEAVLSVPNEPLTSMVAIIGHPHSLQGGTMNNKVVTTLSRLFKEEHIINLRFNFRGVGATEGIYDAGVGESEDMLFIAKALQLALPQAHFIFAGFSFGSYVAYRAAGQFPHVALISIAPPVHHYDYKAFKINKPWFIVQGDADEVVPTEAVESFIHHITPQPILIMFKETGHFFHGKLLELKAELLNAFKAKGVV